MLDPESRGAFAGLSTRHDRGALARAVLEGVAFGLRGCLDLVRAAGVSVTGARVSGGGAQSALWLEILASVLGLPLDVVEVPEAAAYGAALLGGVCVPESGNLARRRRRRACGRARWSSRARSGSTGTPSSTCGSGVSTRRCASWQAGRSAGSSPPRRSSTPVGRDASASGVATGHTYIDDGSLWPSRRPAGAFAARLRDDLKVGPLWVRSSERTQWCQSGHIRAVPSGRRVASAPWLAPPPFTSAPPVATRAPRWAGQCPGCGEWNTLVEEVRAPRVGPSGRGRRHGRRGWARAPDTGARSASSTARSTYGSRPGSASSTASSAAASCPDSLVLIGGAPGIGKSTLTAMALANLVAAGRRTLYVSAEESAAQIRLRAERLRSLPRSRSRWSPRPTSTRCWRRSRPSDPRCA